MLDDLTRHPSSNVRRAAIRVLGRTGDVRALSILEHAYERTTVDDVLEALGDLGAAAGAAIVHTILAKEVGDLTAPHTLEVIRARALEDLDTSCPRKVVLGAEALAKLGDFSLVNLMRGLARFMVDEEETICAFMVRIAAIRALDVSVGAGIATTLEQCYDDPGEDDVVWWALDAMLHLGRVAAVDRWIELLPSDRPGVQYGAMSCIDRLIGERPPHVRAEAESWWNKRRPRFDPAICYCAGKPATPGSLVRIARGRHAKKTRAHLRQMAGLAFITPLLVPPAVPETEAIDAWWSTHTTAFPPGKLHRWGRSYDPSACD
jgi:hypothetical protein